MEKPIQAIVFDLGGVLAELAGVASIINWSKQRLSEDDLWQRWLHSAAVRDFETGKIEPADFARQLVAEFQLTVDDETFLQAFIAWPTRLFPGTLELLSGLKERYTVACLSNTNALHWPRVQYEMKLDGHLHHAFISYKLGKIKPDAEIFHHLVEALELSPEQILFYDDNIINVNSARNIGLQAAHVKGLAEVVHHLEYKQLYRSPTEK